MKAMDLVRDRAPGWPGFPRLLAALVVYKLVFFNLCLWATWGLSWWEAGAYGRVMSWPLEGSATLASRFATWDAAHYLFLAETGYVGGSGSCAFYPLWPGLIFMGSALTGGNVFWSGLILANLISLAALLQFHGLVREQHDERLADAALLLLLAFPGAIFFNFIYTEALFLFLAVLFFRCLFRDDYGKAAIIAFLLPLTKAIGVFVCVPLFWRLCAQRRPARDYLALGGPGLGYAAYFLVMWLFTGNPFEGFVAQQSYPNQPSIGNVLDLGGALRGFFNIGSFNAGTDSAVDRYLFLVAAGALALVWRLDKTYFAYSVLAVLIPALSNIFWSYSRQMMMAFPVFIALAVWLQDRERRWLWWYLLLLMTGLQLYMIARYVNFNWAA